MVRALGVVGVPFLPSRAPSRMEEMSSVALVVGLVGESGWSKPVFLSCLVHIEVANDRESEVCMGCALQWRETKATLLAGCLYAAGARKGSSGCEERSIVSPAFMKSITARDRVQRGRWRVAMGVWV